jgi:hypothetical protein
MWTVRSQYKRIIITTWQHCPKVGVLYYPLRLVLGLFPATFEYEGAEPLDTARAISLRSAATGFSSFLDSVLLEAGAFQ